MDFIGLLVIKHMCIKYFKVIYVKMIVEIGRGTLLGYLYEVGGNWLVIACM